MLIIVVGRARENTLRFIMLMILRTYWDRVQQARVDEHCKITRPCARRKRNHVYDDCTTDDHWNVFARITTRFRWKSKENEKKLIRSYWRELTGDAFQFRRTSLSIFIYNNILMYLCVCTCVCVSTTWWHSRATLSFGEWTWQSGRFVGLRNSLRARTCEDLYLNATRLRRYLQSSFHRSRRIRYQLSSIKYNARTNEWLSTCFKKLKASSLPNYWNGDGEREGNPSKHSHIVLPPWIKRSANTL
jgi:hypothetical protein